LSFLLLDTRAISTIFSSGSGVMVNRRTFIGCLIDGTK
jgi:hypothetical protein